MINLRYYDTRLVEASAAETAEHYSRGLINLHELNNSLNRFVLRDGNGRYWAFDGRSGEWHLFSDGTWRTGKRPPARLEGPADLQVFESLSADEIQALINEKEAQLAAPLVKRPAPPVLLEVVESIDESYFQGDISLEDELAMLVAHFLVDSQGRPWTVGVNSRSWYVFEEVEWKRANHKPVEGELLTAPLTDSVCPSCGKEVKDELHCPYCGAKLPPPVDLADEEATERLWDFLVFHLGMLPEQPSSPWEPPAWSLEAVQVEGITCPHCSAHNPSGSVYCNRCGYPLAVKN